MTDSQKLETIIKRAIERGFEPLDVDLVVRDCFRLGGWHLNQVLFDKQFARSYWPEGLSSAFKCAHCDLYSGFQDSWKAHLQQAVISDNPIDYYFDHGGEA